MRLGANLFGSYDDPDAWVQLVQARGYRAAYCPVALDADVEEIKAYRATAQAADIVIAEVGAWSNPLASDDAERAAAIAKCQRALYVADEIGAPCAVNITGSRGSRWDGPHPLNLTDETFEMIVATTRLIIDEVQPRAAAYTLETMPWMYPDSVDSYLALLEAIDRPACAAHFDPVNLICSPQRYFANADVIRDGLRRLGPYLRSCHAKDIQLSDRLTTHLDEVTPGHGALDYGVYLRELDRLHADIPLMIEHLPNEEAYDAAATHIRGVAARDGIRI